MASGTCNLGLESLPGYAELQKKAKTILRGSYNDSTFNAVMQKYYDEKGSLPNSTWIQTHLNAFKQSSSPAVQNEGEKNLSSGTEGSKQKKTEPRERWSNKSEGGFEIGKNATSDLGKKFDPLKAILPKGTILTRKVGRRYEHYDVSGYSIAAAFAYLKGYDQHGSMAPKTTKEINGYGGKVLSTSYLYTTKRQSERLFNAYKELWSRWANGNPDIIAQLREAVGDGIITDSSATGMLYNLNPAKAMAEILFGK